MSDGGGALAISVVGLVPTVYMMHLPPISAVRESADDAGHYAASLRMATLSSAVLVAGTAAVTGSPEVALAGAVTIFALTALYTHARAVPPWGLAGP